MVVVVVAVGVVVVVAVAGVGVIGMKPAPTPAQIVAKEMNRVKREHLELTYYQQIKQAGLPLPKRQFKAIPGRDFAFDFAWPECMICVEINGSIWQKGKHNTGVGLRRDYEKANLANLASWCILVFTAEDLKDGTALEQTREALSLLTPF